MISDPRMRSLGKIAARVGVMVARGERADETEAFAFGIAECGVRIAARVDAQLNQRHEGVILLFDRLRVAYEREYRAAEFQRGGS